jgi:hypothetical protein
MQLKRTIRIITNTGSRDSCCQLFKQLQILSFPSQYIFSLLVFVNKNRGLFQSNSEIHDLNTRFNYNLHLPSTNLTLVQKGVLYSGSKMYNHLTSDIKVLSKDVKRFKSTLKSYLIEHMFYSLDKFYQSASQWSRFFVFLLDYLIAIRSYLVSKVTYSYYSLLSCLSYLYFTYSLCYDKCTAHFSVLLWPFPYL